MGQAAASGLEARVEWGLEWSEDPELMLPLPGCSLGARGAGNHRTNQAGRDL